MMRQPIGVYHSAHKGRYDTTASTLTMPQAPLAVTQEYKLQGLTEAPSTQTAMLSFMTWGGYNQEDGIIVKKEWAERAGISVKYQSFSDSIQDAGSDSIGEAFGELPEVLRKGGADVYALIDRATGAARQGMRLRKGSRYCLIAKYSSVVVEGSVRYVDNSTYVKGVDAMIDAVEIIRNSGKTVIHVRISELRFPIVGNKFASRSAQKSIVAMLMPAALMPPLYDPRSGKTVAPDIIMNPLAMPTRMTISQPLEMFSSIFAVLAGRTADVSSFKGFSVDDFKRKLADMGHRNAGTYYMQFNPVTGDAMQQKVFMAPISYQILRHMVLDKEQMRGTMGPKATNGQPIHKKEAGGGMKFSIMENDAMMAYGLYEPLVEKAIHASDAMYYYYCDACNQKIDYNKHTQSYTCSACQHAERDYNPMRVRMPFATMSFRQQFAVMGVLVDPIIEPSPQDMRFARLGERGAYLEDEDGNPRPERAPALPQSLADANPPPKRAQKTILRRRRKD